MSAGDSSLEPNCSRTAAAWKTEGPESRVIRNLDFAYSSVYAIFNIRITHDDFPLIAQTTYAELLERCETVLPGSVFWTLPEDGYGDIPRAASQERPPATEVFDALVSKVAAVTFAPPDAA